MLPSALAALPIIAVRAAIVALAALAARAVCPALDAFAAAAWSLVEKIFQELHLTDAPI